jgi:phosphoribosylformylglycinamidine cyclo-ligase
MAHITGGGLVENVPRVIPDGMQVRIDARTWTLPPVFAWLAKVGLVAPAEMVRVFNCGIGMVVIVPAAQKNAAIGVLRDAGEAPIEIGSVVARKDADAPGCVVENLDAWKI